MVSGGATSKDLIYGSVTVSGSEPTFDGNYVTYNGGVLTLNSSAVDASTIVTSDTVESGGVLTLNGDVLDIGTTILNSGSLVASASSDEALMFGEQVYGTLRTTSQLGAMLA